MTTYVKRAPIDADKGRSRMWQTMRMLPRFTTADLQATAEVSCSAAKRYVLALHTAGYLRLMRHAENHLGGHAVYHLLRNTGPYAPRVGKDRVRDPNLEPKAKPQLVTLPKAEYERALRCIDVVQKLRAFAPTEAIRKTAATALEIAR